MSTARFARARKRQLGQFLTPDPVARAIVASAPLTRSSRVLEPSFGDGAFLVPLLERLYDLHDGTARERVEAILRENLYGVEIDGELFRRFQERVVRRFGSFPRRHNLYRGDFFEWMPDEPPRLLSPREYRSRDRRFFDLVIGNPPFGGSIDARYQDALDRVLGSRHGENIKKETYSFFVVKGLDLLKDGGRMLLICSDTFLTINTMRGLRRLLMESGEVRVRALGRFSDETDHPMVLLDAVRTGRRARSIEVCGTALSCEDVESTGNLSWRLDPELAGYFGGPVLGDVMTATSGMTIGANELFVREIRDGTILEPYRFEFYEHRITLEEELRRARLGTLSRRSRERVATLEREGAMRRNVRAVPLATPRVIRLPHPDYCLYNKASSGILHTAPRHVVFWKDDGDAVLTFKRNGNWYLRGVGGRPHFRRSGLTWQLISSRLCTRFLPEGYILDSGAPCAFLGHGVEQDELWFVLGWTLTDLCNQLLKQVINHTRNIQGKDLERLPYPSWVRAGEKGAIVARVKELVARAREGTRFSFESPEVRALNGEYAHPRLRVPGGAAARGERLGAAGPPGDVADERGTG